MIKKEKSFKSNLFEIDNARNLTRDQLVKTFVPTKNYWRLLSAKNHIVLGSRGSGKTALAKMLSHDHLSHFKQPRAKKIINSISYIGIYVPTSVEWVGGLKNKLWQTEAEAEFFFQWRLNISTCLSFLVTLRSCLDTYIANEEERARIERKIISELSTSWSGNEYSEQSISELQKYLKKIEFEKQQQLAKKRVLNKLPDDERIIGISFEGELFTLLKRGIDIASEILNFPSHTAWLLCLDEAEFLEKMHHRILNTYLRSYSKNLFFKIITKPYCHYTLDTNTNVSLDVGHDFDYVYIDKDILQIKRNENEYEENFADKLFEKRAKNSGKNYKKINLNTLLGDSLLLDNKKWDFEKDMKNLEKYASFETLERVHKLLKTPEKFDQEIARKMRGALLLRNEVENQRGHKKLAIYSGRKLVIRCGDANPRRLISLFNNLLLEVNWKDIDKKKPLLSQGDQTNILITFSQSCLSRIQSEKKIGPRLYNLIKEIGNYMKRNLYDKKLSTDQVSSIEVDNEITNENWDLIKHRFSQIGYPSQ